MRFLAYSFPNDGSVRTLSGTDPTNMGSEPEGSVPAETRKTYRSWLRIRSRGLKVLEMEDSYYFFSQVINRLTYEKI